MACWGSLVLAGGAAGSASYFTHPHHPPSFLLSVAKTISTHSLGEDPVQPALDAMPNSLGSVFSSTPTTTPSNPAKIRFSQTYLQYTVFQYCIYNRVLVYNVLQPFLSH